MTPSSSMEQFATIHAIIEAARPKLTQLNWDYLMGGSESETSYRRNRAALDSVALRASVLNDVSAISLTSEFLGHSAALPVGLGAVGSPGSFNDEGQLGVAKAGARADVPTFLNALDDPQFEKFGELAPTTRFLTVYPYGNAEWLLGVAETAERMGFAGLAITVDSAVYSRRERDIQNKFIKTWHLHHSELHPHSRPLSKLSWSDVEATRKQTNFPLILKGIMDVDDARRSADLGVDGVYISNHGGRQLDHGQAALEVLPGIVEAVGGHVPVIIDGGFLRGTDIIKAIAMGADLVVLGRLWVLAYAAGGTDGIIRLIELLRDEMTRNLALMGVANLGELKPDRVVGSINVAPETIFASFPLLKM